MFKIGDKCKVLNLNISGGDYRHIGQTVEITNVYPEYYQGIFDDRITYTLRDSELELLNNKKTMNKLNSMMKCLLDSDTKTLVKAGYINGDLLLTQDGQDALNSIVFEINKAQLVKKAEEKLAEEKEDK